MLLRPSELQLAQAVSGLVRPSHATNPMGTSTNRVSTSSQTCRLLAASFPVQLCTAFFSGRQYSRSRALPPTVSWSDWAQLCFTVTANMARTQRQRRMSHNHRLCRTWNSAGHHNDEVLRRFASSGRF